MGTIVSNSHTLNRVGLFSDFIFVKVNDMNIYFFLENIYIQEYSYVPYLHGIQDILCTYP